jgi:hypothetical protein
MMVELALESNSTEPKGVWQDFLDLSWQRPILARRREVQRSLRTDVGCDGAERSNQMGATRGPKRALEGPPLHGDDWTAGLLEATGDLLCPLHVAPRHSIAYDECPQPRTCTA